MGMSRRDLLLAERQIETNQELIDAIKSGKGKEYRKEKEALLEVLGGKARLDNLDKEEAEAREKIRKMLSQAKVDAELIIAEAKNNASAEMERVNKAKRDIADERANIAAQKKNNDEDRLRLKEQLLDLNGRITDADKRDDELNRRESAIRAAEARIAEQEARIARFHSWLKSAPV